MNNAIRMEVFARAPWMVEIELEMALKSQLLDVAIIAAETPAQHLGT